MKAVVKTGPVEGLEILEVPVPVIAPDEALIKVTATSICGTDVHIYHWDEWARERVRNLPQIAGHEFCGRIEAVGSQVKSFGAGDYVSAETHIYCSRCPICLERNFHLCENVKIIGVDRDGCFAEYVALPERVLWKNDLDLPPFAASIQEPLGNAVYCALIEDVACKTVVIFGDGPAGLFASEVARVSGAREVILVGAEEYRLDIGRRLGLTVINALESDPVACVKNMTGGRGADVVLEMSGAPAAIEKAMLTAKRGGRVCAFGISPEKRVSLGWNNIVFSGLTVYGIHGRLIFDTWIKVKELLKAGVLNLGPIITHRFPMEHYREAFELACSRQCGKIILFP